MKIVVAIKQVANLDDEFELPEDGSVVDPDYLELDLNEWDNFSVEAALELRETAGGGEVIAVTVGNSEAEEVLLNALARGVDRAVRIWDEELVDADVLQVARVLAALVQSESPDVVLCGVQSSDAVNSATGIALAGYADLPHVAVVTRLEVTGATATVERELEGGLIEVLRVELPALFTVQTGINEPRYATLRAIKQAREKPLAVLGLTAVGLSSEQLASAAAGRRQRLRLPERGQDAQMLSGSPEDVAEQIVSIVREQVG